MREAGSVLVQGFPKGAEGGQELAGRDDRGGVEGADFRGEEMSRRCHIKR